MKTSWVLALAGWLVFLAPFTRCVAAEEVVPRLTPPAPAGPLDWSAVFETGQPLPDVVGLAPDEQDSGAPFVRGRLTLELGTGAYFAPIGIGPHIRTFDYTPLDLRLGCILTTPGNPGWLRGSLEGLVDLTAAPVVNGFGNVLGAASLLLRYNFVQPDCRLVPYVQLGGGLLLTDAYEDRSQRAIGQAFEFLLQAGVGCRWFLNEHWSVNAEAGFQHISNACLTDRNGGVNALGGLLSISYFFPGGR